MKKIIRVLKLLIAAYVLGIFLGFVIGSPAHAEYLVSGSKEDIAVDYATACSMAAGAHQFDVRSRRVQLSTSFLGLGGQNCGSFALGKRVSKSAFVSLGYTLSRGDNAFLLQGTFELR